MKKLLFRYWKSLTAFGLVVALLGTMIHAEVIRLSWNWVETRALWAAQTVTGSQTTSSKPSGPQCVDVENLQEAFTSITSDLKSAQVASKRREAKESENKVPEELLRNRQPVPTYQPQTVGSIQLSIQGPLLADACDRVQVSGDTVTDEQQRQYGPMGAGLQTIGANQANLVVKNGSLAYELKLGGTPEVVTYAYLCQDGKFRTLDGILTFPDEEGRASSIEMINRMRNYEDLLLKKVLAMLPSQPYSKADLEAIFDTVNNSLGVKALSILDLGGVFSRNNDGEVVISDGTVFFLDYSRVGYGQRSAPLAHYDLSEDLDYRRFKSWRPGAFGTIKGLPRELREWGKENRATNVLTEEEVNASSVLTDLRNVFTDYTQGAIVTRREEWTLIQQKQYKNYQTIQEARQAAGRTGLSFVIDPHTQHISIYGAGKSYTFEHVGDNIYEYREPDGTVWRWLITGSVKNLQQGAALFDRISKGQEPEDIVRMNSDGTEWTYQGTDTLQLGDLSYPDWKKTLKSQKEDAELRLEAERERLLRDFNSQPRDVQLRIKQLEIFQQDLNAYKTEIEKASASRFAAFLRQTYAKYHPLGENGLGVFDFGGSESNFKERISAMVSLFVDTYLTPRAPSNKSRLQELLEQNPTLTLQDILTAVDSEGKGVYIKDPALGEFIRNIFLNYSALGFTVTHYSYEDPDTQADLDRDQLELLERLSGTFFDDYDPAEDGSLDSWLEKHPGLTIGKRFVESIAGKRQFVQFEAQVFDMLDSEINAVIATECNTYLQNQNFRQEAIQDVNASLDRPAVDKKGKARGMSVREWLRVDPNTQFGTDQMKQVVENMVAQRVKFLKRQCAVKHMLTLKDAKGNVTGGLADPTKRKAFQLYVKIFDLTSDWFTISKQSWNTIFDEILINAPLMLVSAGTASLILRSATALLGRLGTAAVRGALLFSRAYRSTSRIARAGYRVMRSVYRAQRTGFTLLRPIGSVVRSLSEGALEGFFEQALSLQTLETIATGRSKRTGEDWVKAMAFEAIFEGVFDLAGGFTRKFFRKNAKFQDAIGRAKYQEISTSFARRLRKFVSDNNIKIGEEVLQGINAWVVMMGISQVTRQSPDGKLDNSVASNLLGDQTFLKDALHNALQVLSFTYGRKIALRISEGTPWLQSFFAGGHGSVERGTALKNLNRVRTDIQGVDGRISGLQTRLDSGRLSDRDARRARKEMLELQEVRKSLQGQQQEYTVARIADIDAEIASIDQTITQEGLDFARSQGLLDSRQDLLNRKQSLQQSFVQGTLSEYDGYLQQLSLNIQMLQGLASDTGITAEHRSKLNEQIAEQRRIMFQVSQAKNAFSAKRVEQLQGQRAEVRSSIDQLRAQGASAADVAALLALDTKMTRELRDLREQRTDVQTEAEYQALVRQHTADGTFQVTNEYGHIDLATGHWYVNRAKLRADAQALADQVNQQSPADVAQQIRGMNDADLGRMIALPADIEARQQALNDLRAQLEQDPALVDQGRGVDGQGLSLRNLLVRNRQRNLLEGHVRHEMGHRFERALDPATRNDLADALGHDLSDPAAREDFEENVADWLSGDLDAATTTEIENFFRDRIRAANPDYTDAQIDQELANMKRLDRIRENFLANYQADVGVDFQRGAERGAADTDRMRYRNLGEEYNRRKRAGTYAARFFSASQVQSALRKHGTNAAKADFLQGVLDLMDSSVFTKPDSELTVDERRQREALEALRSNNLLELDFVTAVINDFNYPLSSGEGFIYYNPDSLLGRGGFGAVYRGVVIRGTETRPVALKTFHTIAPAAEHEVRVSQYLMHQQDQMGEDFPSGLIRIEGTSLELDASGSPTFIAIAQELITPPAGKDIQLDEFEFDSQAQAEQFVVDTFRALQGVFELGFVVNDLKPENIGVRQNPDGSISPVILDPGSWMMTGVPEGTTGIDDSVPVRSGSFDLAYLTADGRHQTGRVPLGRLTFGGKLLSGVITTPAFRPGARQTYRFETRGNRDVLTIDQYVRVKSDGKKSYLHGEEMRRTSQRKYLSHPGVDGYSLGMTFLKLLQGEHDVPRIYFKRDGDYTRFPLADSNLADLLGPDFAADLIDISETLIGLRRNDDGSLSFDERVVQQERVADLLDVADDLLDAVKIEPEPTSVSGYDPNADINNLIENQGTIQPPEGLVRALQTDVDGAREALLNRLAGDADPDQRRLIEQTFIDPMTGMLNRAGLAFLDNMIANGQRVSVLSYDGDHFGANNQVLSTQYGDALIQLMAKNFHQLVNRLRAQGYDVQAVRMGGEEFVLFGDIDLDMLKSAMQEMIDAQKGEIRDLHDVEVLDALANYLAQGTYTGQGEAGFDRARAEIGGSTAGVIGFNFDGRQSDIADAGGPSAIRANALQYTDQWLEFGKSEGGRGRIYETEDVPNRRDDDTDRLFDFTPESELGESQQNVMEGIRADLDAEVQADFEARLRQRNAFFGELGLNEAQQDVVNTYLAQPGYDLASAQSLATRIAGALGGDINVLTQRLLDLKNEYFITVRDFGGYTGAATMFYLSNLDESYGAARRLEPGQFKSINETMGHTHGDTFLIHVYRNVILETARQLGYGPNDIVVAQRGASFVYRFKRAEGITDAQYEGEQRAFERLLAENYASELSILVDRMGTDSDGQSYDDIRLEWLEQNRSSLEDPTFANRFQILPSDATLPAPADGPILRPAAPSVDANATLQEAGLMSPELENAFAQGNVIVEPAQSGDGSVVTIVTPTTTDFELGRGGFATVYRGFAIDPDGAVREVAVKQNRPLLTEDDPRAHALREAAKARELMRRQVEDPNHPDILARVEGISADQTRIVTELVRSPDGTPSEWGSYQFPSADAAAQFAADVLQGLLDMQRAGIGHFDIKPDNILVGPDGRPVISDNGTIVLHGSEGSYGDARDGLTAEGQGLFEGILPGTPAYQLGSGGLSSLIKISDLDGVTNNTADFYAFAQSLRFLLNGSISSTNLSQLFPEGSDARARLQKLADDIEAKVREFINRNESNPDKPLEQYQAELDTLIELSIDTLQNLGQPIQTDIDVALQSYAEAQGLDPALLQDYQNAVDQGRSQTVIMPGGEVTVFVGQSVVSENQSTVIRNGFYVNDDGVVVEVVVKNLRVSADQEARIRFEHEKKMSRYLADHRSELDGSVTPVVAVSDGSGSFGEGFIVTQKASDQDFNSLRDKSLTQVLTAFINAARGLQSLVDAGVIHLDVHGENLRSDGSIIDFDRSVVVDNPAFNLQSVLIDNGLDPNLFLVFGLDTESGGLLFDFAQQVDPQTGQIRGINDARPGVLDFALFVQNFLSARDRALPDWRADLQQNNPLAFALLSTLEARLASVDVEIQQSFDPTQDADVPTFAEFQTAFQNLLDVLLASRSAAPTIEPLADRLPQISDVAELSAYDWIGGQDSRFADYIRTQNGGQDPLIVTVDRRSGQILDEALQAARDQVGGDGYVVVQYVRDTFAGTQSTVVVDTVDTLAAKTDAIQSYENSVIGQDFAFHIQRTFAPDGVVLDLIAFRSDLRGQGFGGAVLRNNEAIVSSSSLNPSGNVRSNPINFITARDIFYRYGADLDIDQMTDNYGNISNTTEFYIRLGLVERSDFDRPGQTNLLEASDIAPVQIRDRFFEVLSQKSVDYGMNSFEYLLHKAELYIEGQIRADLASGRLVDPDDATSSEARQAALEALRNRRERYYRELFPGVYVQGNVAFDIDSSTQRQRTQLKNELLSLETALAELNESINLAETAQLNQLFQQLTDLQNRIDAVKTQLRNVDTRQTERAPEPFTFPPEIQALEAEIAELQGIVDRAETVFTDPSVPPAEKFALVDEAARAGADAEAKRAELYQAKITDPDYQAALSTAVGQISALGLRDGDFLNRILNDFDLQFSPVDGTLLATPEQRLAYAQRLASLSEIELQWYRNKPASAPAPANGRSYTGEEGQAIEASGVFNRIKDYNSQFTRDVVLPYLLSRGVPLESTFRQLHIWTARGTDAQLYDVSEQGENFVGRYRQNPDEIVAIGAHKPPVPSEVTGLMNDLATHFDGLVNDLQARRATMSPESYERAAVRLAFTLHHEFVAIHPFLNGNGRTARALYTMVIDQLLGPGHRLSTLPLQTRPDGSLTVASEINTYMSSYDQQLYYPDNEVSTIADRDAFPERFRDFLQSQTVDALTSDSHVFDGAVDFIIGSRQVSYRLNMADSSGSSEIMKYLARVTELIESRRGDMGLLKSFTAQLMIRDEQDQIMRREMFQLEHQQRLLADQVLREWLSSLSHLL